jgi:hypothetical protein
VTELAPQMLCKVCRQPVDPKVDVLFGALGRPLFAAHKERCAPFVRDVTQRLGGLTKTLLQAKKPELYAKVTDGVDLAQRFWKFMRDGQ